MNTSITTFASAHSWPAIAIPRSMKAVEKRLSTGTMFGMPHDMEWELAEKICDRFPVEMVRFGNSGTEATDACRPPGPRRHGSGQDS